MVGMKKKTDILALVGPTAVGKTGLSLKLAETLSGEIIGLDSRQIYAGMAVGTAQPTSAELARVPHHLIGIKAPDEKITAGEYAALASEIVAQVTERGNTPLLCGGAGLYYRALKHGIFPGSRADEEIRQRLEKEYRESPSAMLARLRKIDPVYAAKVHPNNRKRLVRALEIHAVTGVPPSKHFARQPANKYNYRIFTVLLSRSMAELENRIRARTEEMLNGNWLGEVEALLAKWRVAEIPAFDSIGYRSILAYRDGQVDYGELKDLIILRTRQYAKRQLTWFKREQPEMVIDLDRSNDDNEIIDRIVNGYGEFTAD